MRRADVRKAMPRDDPAKLAHKMGAVRRFAHDEERRSQDFPDEGVRRRRPGFFPPESLCLL